MAISEFSMYNKGYLQHHGILGQRWGKRNGPPYPLDSEDHSTSEKKAGWRKSLDTDSDKKEKDKTTKQEGESRKRGLTSGQKKALIIGGTVIAVSAALYTAKRMGALDNVSILRGRDLLSGKTNNDAIKSALNAEYSDIADSIQGRLKHVSESISDSLSKANPLRGSATGENNCTCSSIAGILRTMGYDVTAKGTGGQRQLLGGMIENIFKGAHVFDGSAVKFGKSPEDAAEMLIKKFGNNAKGVVGIQWKGMNSGHAFSWIIENGKVRFLDFQNNWDDSFIRSVFWNKIDPNGVLSFAELKDSMEIDFDELSKYVNFK